jgi:hypothetical protein
VLLVDLELVLLVELRAIIAAAELAERSGRRSSGTRIQYGEEGGTRWDGSLTVTLLGGRDA